MTQLGNLAFWCRGLHLNFLHLVWLLSNFFASRVITFPNDRNQTPLHTKKKKVCESGVGPPTVCPELASSAHVERKKKSARRLHHGSSPFPSPCYLLSLVFVGSSPFCSLFIFLELPFNECPRPEYVSLMTTGGTLVGSVNARQSRKLHILYIQL